MIALTKPMRVLWLACLPIVWLLSVVAAFRGGFEHGLEPPSFVGTLQPYPWLPVLATCLIVGVQVGAIYLVVRPRSFLWSWGRAASALALSLLLLLFGNLTAYTDLPGYAYVPSGTSFDLVVFTLPLFLIVSTVRFSRRSTAKLNSGAPAV